MVNPQHLEVGRRLVPACLSRRRFIAFSAAMASATATSGCLPATFSPESLRGAAAISKRWYYGAAVRMSELSADANFRDAVRRECAWLVPEIALKWNHVEPRMNHRTFSDMDAILTFAEANAMTVRGHNLLWHRSIPAWAEAALRRDRDWSLIARHFERVLGRYGDVITQWDVVNEPIDTRYRTDGLRRSVFFDAFGPDYIARALWEAHRLAPSAQLMLNEYGLEYGGQVEKDRRYLFLKLLRRLRAANVPLHGVGLQSHLDLGKGPLAEDAYRAFLRAIADLGLFIVITELDVKEYDYVAQAGHRDAMVASEVRRFLGVALDEPAVRGVLTWGLSDRYSWLTVTPQDYARYPGAWHDGTGPGLNRGLPLDAGLMPKPMYTVLHDAFAGIRT